MGMKHTHTQTHTTNTATSPSPSVPVMVELPLMHDNASYVILDDVIQTLLCFDDWSSVSVRQKVQ